MKTFTLTKTLTIFGALTLFGVQAYAQDSEDHMHHHHHAQNVDSHHKGESDEDRKEREITGSEKKAVSIEAKNCWIRLMPDEMPSAAYFTIENHSHGDTALAGVKVEGFKKSMLHRIVKDEKGASSMTMVKKVLVSKDDDLEFKPGSFHVMLEGASSKIKAGDTVGIQYKFDSDEVLGGDCKVNSPKAQKYSDK